MMDNHRGLREVRVSKVELLQRLKSNRAKHWEEFCAAEVGYEEKFLALLVKAGELAKGYTTPPAGGGLPPDIEMGDIEEVYDKIEVLPKPFNRVESYDDTIALVEASVDDFFVLPQSDFNNYWLDKWSWKGQFETTNASYG
jgi:hypothetical protein